MPRHFDRPPDSALRMRLERTMLLDARRTKIAMKTSQEPQPRRRSRRDPWNSKNIKLIRAALRVWELKQRSAGRW
jgi:hypothetical protein